MEITLLIMENHGVVILNFCGNPGISSDTDSHSDANDTTVFNFLLFVVNAKGYNINPH